MPNAGYVDLKLLFPDAATGRGRVVNTIALQVLNATGVEIDTFGIEDLERVETVLEGIYYVRRDYVVSDLTKTPDTYITLNYTATIGMEVTTLQTQLVSFQPAMGDLTSGVLLSWSPPEIVEKGRNTVDPLFYEVRRVDERHGLTAREQTQFVPETYTTSFWPFDDDYEDDAPTPADLVAVGTVEHLPASGIIGGCVRFNANGYLSTPNPAKLSYAAGQDFSLCAWVTVTPLFTRGLVAGKIDALSGQGYGIFIEKVGQYYVPVVVINGPINQVVYTSSVNLQDGLQHYLVATFDRDGNGTLYVDGVLEHVFDVSSTANVDFTTEDFCIGGSAGGNLITGLVDEVIVFDRVLTWIDVEKLYNDQYGALYAEVLGRTTFTQFVDTNIGNPYQMRHYRWTIYQARHVQPEQPGGADYKLTLYKTITVKEVDFIDAPMCFVEGRVRLPTDQYPGAAIAKFLVAPWDRGQIVHDRILSRDQWWCDIDRNGRFGAFLIQDSVVVCHIPSAHVQWRFCVPRQERTTLQELESQGKIEKLKFRINV